MVIKTKSMVGRKLYIFWMMVFLVSFNQKALSSEIRPGAGEENRHDWRLLEDRVESIEEEAGQCPPVEEKVEECKNGLFGRFVQFSGLVEFEGFVSKDYEGEEDDDLVLSTIEGHFHILPEEIISGHLLLLWQEDDKESLEIDEAVISIGRPEESPFFINAGKFYVPFGMNSSLMIQDPLTLGIGESNETAFLVGVDYGGFFASVYAFNGDMDDSGSENRIDNFGISTGYSFERDDFHFHTGIDYINSIADADGLTEALEDNDINTLNDYVPGMATYMHMFLGPYTLYGEYAGSLDEFEVDELSFKGEGAKPEAWYLEMTYSFQVLERETILAAGFQRSNESIALGLPEKRYIASANISFTEDITWTVEYVHDVDYSRDDDGSGEKGRIISTRLSVEF